MNDDIQILLQQEQEILKNLEEKERKIREELDTIKKDKLLSKGKILAYQQLITGTSGSLADNNSNQNNANQNSLKSANKPKRKKRAARATNKEMEERRMLVGKYLLENGAMYSKDIQHFLGEHFGEELATTHHLRAIFNKFPDDFESKEEHGVWGITDSFKDYLEAAEEDVGDTE